MASTQSPRHEPSLGSATLLLFPTDLERRRVDDHGGVPQGLALSALCGFGPVAAAARTAELLALHRPARVLLVGIAGAYDTELHPIGSALEFDEVAVEGIGVGEGRELLAPPALGFPQWPGRHGQTDGAIFDRTRLASANPEARGKLLLTTCAASANAAQAAQRRERHPDALAEDMEGFAVATACALAHVPLRIVRGISNLVGDRAPERWRIPLALEAARLRALEILERGEGWSTGR
ncbi:MAG: futalosine hydrolase [Planctomycetes bacterium]|nr:futalosine hydrolase [Planctomycetota bacterium]